VALLQESNTWIAQPTTLDHFRQNLLATGEQVRTLMAAAHHEVGGFFAGLAQADIQAVPIFAARAMPYGVMTQDTLDALVRMLSDELFRHLPLDGVLVAPHGATVSQQIADVDGYWLQIVRDAVGPDCPIVGTIDPHANLSPAMVAATDALIAYRTNPHVDQRQRGEEAARLMADTLAGRVRPTQAAAFPPLAINIECQQTDVPPCRPLYEIAERMQAAGEALSTSICLGFPYADVPEMGSAVIAVTNNNPALAQQLADQLGQSMWQMRRQFLPKLTSIDEALDRVQQLVASGELKHSLCLFDMGDNVGGGSPADGTLLAHAINSRQIAGAFVCLCDPAAVEECRRKSAGDRIELSVGGKTDSRHGPPLQTAFTIIAKSNGLFSESQPRHGGNTHFDQGPTVVLRTQHGLTVMLTSQRMAPWSLQQLRHCGLEPADFTILVAKGVHAPLAAYREVCEQLIRVNTAGVTSADLNTFDFRHRRRPMFPFEADANWSVETPTQPAREVTA
jgi:microcystin degradation protein MlrC